MKGTCALAPAARLVASAFACSILAFSLGSPSLASPHSSVSLEQILRFDSGPARPRVGSGSDARHAAPQLAATSFPGRTLYGDDDHWWNLFGPAGSGMDGNVHALVFYGDNVYAGGEFTTAGGARAQHIARWDGTAWSPVGTGLDGPVYALTVYGGSLIAGGSFYAAGSTEVHNVARWDGITWSPLGSGVDGPVRAFQVLGGSVVAAGDFGAAGDAPAGQIASWNGVVWKPLGTGFSGGSGGLGVRALALYAGDLVAGGFFTQADSLSANHIARWDGASWRPLGAWLNDAVYSLTLFDGALVAGSVVWTPGAGTWENMLGRWDGHSWSPIGTGQLQGPFSQGIRSLTVAAGELIVGGVFGLAGGVSAVDLARWDGGTWKAMGPGMNGNVLALAVKDARVIAGGVFTVIGSSAFLHVATWDGTTWNHMDNVGLGLDGRAFALTVFRDHLIAAGEFTNAGGQPASHVASWDGGTWQALGSGTNATIYALAEFGGDLVAGGDFTVAGGGPASHLARWNGGSWTPLGPGTNGRVQVLHVHDGALVAGGDFTTAGGAAAKQIARWDGSSWSPFGAGFSGGAAQRGVRSLASYGGNLIAGGFFTQSDSTPIQYVAIWNGTSWSQLGDWQNDTGYSMTLFRGDLIAGSVVWTEGTGTWENVIESWDGSAWHPLGSGALVGPFSQGIRSIAAYGGELVAGGVFQSAGGSAAQDVARWNGSSWGALGSGVNGNTFTLAAWNGVLYLGGEFTTAGGKPSYYVAAWDGSATIPVQVRSFEATSSAGRVQLAWELSDSALRALRGVRVQRAPETAGPWVERTRTPLEPAGRMSFEDTDVKAGRRVWYRLVLVTAGGEEVAGSPLGVDVALASWRSELRAVRETGAGRPIEIRYAIGPGRRAARLAVYDVRGRRVRLLRDAMLDPGEYVLTWDRGDEAGARVARGTYFVQLRAERVRATRKVAILRD